VILAELPEILAAVDEAEALAAVEEGFLRQARGELGLMAIGHLGFAADHGDCHVKGGYLHGDDVFVVKMTNSFHHNPAQGLPVGNGYVSVASARTGEVLAILHDRGRLTDLRTAMAGVLAARAIARPQPRVLGVVGSGTQAELQAQWIARALGIPATLLWARNGARAAALAQRIGASSVPLAELCARADLIVTTTPSTEPLITAAMVQPGIRIVAVGADAPGKRELAVDLVARARIVADSRAQCVDHGETSWAVRAGLVDPASVLELAEVLDRPVAFAEEDTVIADLTGVAVQDLQIAKAVLARITRRRAATNNA
jgi:ornithine cyclodeaminase